MAAPTGTVQRSAVLAGPLLVAASALVLLPDARHSARIATGVAVAGVTAVVALALWFLGHGSMRTAGAAIAAALGAAAAVFLLLSLLGVVLAHSGEHSGLGRVGRG